MKEIHIYIILFIIGLSLSIGCWFVARAWNYNLSYKSFVEKDIYRILNKEGLTTPTP